MVKNTLQILYMHVLVRGIQRYLKTQCGKLICKRAEVITMDEENQMWESNIIGEEAGKQLVETLVYLFVLYFALRGGKEHRRLRWVNAQVVLKYDERIIHSI